MISPPCDSPEQRGRRAAPGAVAQVGSAVVVELEVPIQGGLQEPYVGEEPAAELHAPQLGEDGALRRSTKPLVQAWRGWVRVCWMPRAARAWSNAPR
jgi:hypothetical protein